MQIVSIENSELSSTGTGTKIPDSHFRAVTKESFYFGKEKETLRKEKVTPKPQFLHSCFQVKCYHVFICCT